MRGLVLAWKYFMETFLLFVTLEKIKYRSDLAEE